MKSSSIQKPQAVHEPESRSLITVVIPTHNRADLVIRAVKSVCAQSIRNLEVIVVDDRSVDSTIESVSEIARHDARVQVVANSRTPGACGARNTGLMLAKGEVVGFLDDDDWFAPKKLELQLPLVDHYSVVGCLYQLPGSQKRRAWAIGNRSSRPLIEERMIEDFWWSNRGLNPSSILARKSLLTSIGGFDETLTGAQGIDLVGRLISSYGPAAIVNLPLVHRDVRHGFQTVTGSPRALAGYWRELNKNRHLRSPATARFREAQIYLYSVRHSDRRARAARLFLKGLMRFRMRQVLRHLVLLTSVVRGLARRGKTSSAE